MSENAHTKTYTSYKLKDLFHKQRLRSLKNIAKDTFSNVDSYCDFGSSEGFVTKEIAETIKAKKVYCYDATQKNIDSGREKTGFEFFLLDLNTSSRVGPYPAVTCFETLEHIGKLENGVETILNSCSSDGAVIISVPNEVKLIGFAKAVMKIFFYGYKINELREGTTVREYLWAVLSDKKRISYFRDKDRKGFGTHFGFDYRDIGDILDAKKVDYQWVKSGTTVIYVIRPNSQRNY